ncbi:MULTISPECIES: amidohydrolase [unclassified Cobetia]|uniref:amidohydrolase family protein n=1 Tax=unclassified Cobetia TaxID=2609414 RepID=UPI002097CF2B|nr:MULTISPECIES: amidohydrolase family protein [unclassified Cobetia]MCO7230882.1 amidohydrolase family protein [Cobetia sp. Dlab-2-AX]MCO7234711.1 amidohydrolase family protein [Cobetia sp. Dlab-2-U]
MLSDALQAPVLPAPLAELGEQRERYLATQRDKDLPIIDAHMHVWDPTQNYHPWLCDEPMIPFRYGDYAAIRRPYLPAEHHQAAGEVHRMLGCVYMEAEWARGDALKEVRWIEKTARESGWPNAMIAQAWLDQDDIGEQLEQLCTSAMVKGVRHKPTALERHDPRLATHALPGSLRCPRYQYGVSEVARSGLIFELQVPWWHLEELLPLLQRHPDMPVVINHAGVPVDRHPDTLREWSRALDKVAAWPQVMIKFSGLGVAGQPWRLEDNREVFEIVLRHFGVHRVMFASNFPVDGLVTSLDTLWQAFKDLSRGLSPEHRLKLFCDNAVRRYSLDTSA